MPISLWLDKPAYDDVTVVFSSDQGDFVIFEPESITFSQGGQFETFTVSLRYGAVSGYIELSLEGTASASYHLK